MLSSTPYSFKTCFASEPGTNPEELVAAAHAGCFTMALAFQLQGAGFTPTELATEAAVSLEKEGQGFRISKSALTLRAQVPGIEPDKFEELARTAEKNCPVSKVLNAEITMDFTLGSPPSGRTQARTTPEQRDSAMRLRPDCQSTRF